MEEEKKNDAEGGCECGCGSEKCDCDGGDCRSEARKVKNLVSLAILLAGLFAGSLFVDVAQMVKGGGFSVKNLSKSDVFEADGKTWVAYSEPAVTVKVINDDKCEKCDVSDALVWMRRIVPTIATEKIAYDSQEGKALIDKFGIKTLPAFVFDGDIAKTDFYSQAQVLFDGKDGQYFLETDQIGLPVGKYLEAPVIGDQDASFGQKDAKAKIVVFSDFQCPYCQIFYKNLRSVMEEYKDKAYFAFKEFPLEEIHPQSENAAMAAQCALDQGKFWEYADKLYASQKDWSSAKDASSKFKSYAAALGMNYGQFSSCIDSKKYKDKVDADLKEATDLGLSGTPSVFVNSDFDSGALTADQLKQMIDAELAK